MARCSGDIFIRIDTLITLPINLCISYIMSFRDIHVGVNSAVIIL